MFNKIMTIGCLFTASFFVACNQVEPETEEKTEAIKKDEVWVPEEAKNSELALLMREMYDQNTIIKSRVENGEDVKSFPEKYNNIHTAVATTPSDIDEMYHSFADMYLNTMNQFAEAQLGGKTIAFNNTVKTCIACHQEYCPGPIPKIKKLYIKD